MANISIGGTTIKKINIGTTQIKKVSIGNTLVYTSAEPFYIVDNYVCKQQLHWTLKNSSNLVSNQAKSITWTAGQSRVIISGSLNNDASSAYMTWVSDAIDTKGNAKLYYKAGVQRPDYQGQYVAVNGVQYNVQEATVDISGMSSVVLTVFVGTFAYNALHWQPQNIRFY